MDSQTDVKTVDTVELDKKPFGENHFLIYLFVNEIIQINDGTYYGMAQSVCPSVIFFSQVIFSVPVRSIGLKIT